MGEAEKPFIARCVAALTAAGEFDSPEQRVAVCHAQFPKADTIDPPYDGEVQETELVVDRADDVAGPGEIDVNRSDLCALPPSTRTDEGFLRAPATRVGRTGVQEYRLIDGTIQRELRLDEHVLDPVSLATLEGKPVTLGHPNGRVDAKNARELARGNVNNPRAEGFFLTADLTIYDEETIASIEAGAGELSVGYRTRLIPIVGGVFHQAGHRFDGTKADYLQTRVRGNHVAVLPRGRANEGLPDRPVRIRMDGSEDEMRLDGEGNQIVEREDAPKTTAQFDDLPDAAFAVIRKGGKKDSQGKTVPRSLRALPHHTAAVKDPNDNSTVDRAHLRNALARLDQTDLTPQERTKARAHLEKHAKSVLSSYKENTDMAIIKIDGVEHEVSDEVSAAWSKLQAHADAATKKASEQEAKTDAAEQKLAALEQATADASEAERGVDRFALMKQAEGLVKRPLAELVRLDDAGLRRAILAAKCPKLKLDGKDDSYVAAYLDRENDAEKAVKNSASELRSGSSRISRVDSGESPLLKAFADRTARQNGRAVKE